MNIDQQQEKRSATGITDCPSPETMLGYADSELGRQRTGKVREHLESCGSCAKLVELISPTARCGSVADLSPAARKQDRDLVAGRLGFTRKPPLGHRLLALADGLWQVRAPILLPVSITALLLFVLLPASQPVTRTDQAPLVYQFTEVSHIISTDLTLRNTPAVENRASAGSLIILQHSSSWPELAAGTPVTLKVSGGPGRDRVLLATVSNNGEIEVPLVISRPGRYRLTITCRDSEMLLADLQCTITPPAPSTP